jgi:trk system potassium uptake protein TrkH
LHSKSVYYHFVGVANPDLPNAHTRKGAGVLDTAANNEAIGGGGGNLHHKFLRKLFTNFSSFGLLAFFLTVIFSGALVLKFSGAWPEDLTFTDAVFTAASAVCVAGLSTIDISQFSRAGELTLLCLIQIGGLGIISFSCLTLIIPGRRFGLTGTDAIKNFFLDDIEYRPRLIIRSIIIFTFIIELTGAVLLSFLFYRRSLDDWLFMAVFHSVSAFCNTGLSVLPSQLLIFSDDIPVMLVLCVLVILGGLGFLVLHDILRLAGGRIRKLSYHSKVVLFMTALFLLSGTVLFFIFERGRAFSGMNTLYAAVNSFFQSVNTRSAGFEVTVQSSFCQPSKMLTCLLMIIGGAPGSIAGGIKVTTLFVVLVFLLKKPDKYGDMNVFHHRLRSATIHNALVFVLKALFLLLICICALSVAEGLRGKPLGALIFDSISAFGTVGLGLGITPSLSTAGKWIIIATMFAGRVGLFALSFPAINSKRRDITYPEGSLLLE